MKGEFSSQVADGVDVHSVREPRRRRGGDHALQLPHHGAAVDDGQRDRDGQRRHLEALRARPVGLGATRRAAARGRSADWRLQRDPRQRRHRQPAARAPGHRRGELRRLDAGGAPRLPRGTAHGKRVQALGGAKNHMVVLPDADLDIAADAAINAGFGSAGERCMAISVVVAVGDVADELDREDHRALDRLTVGPGDDPTSDFGPVITKEHRDACVNYVTSAPSDGITVVRDGTALGRQAGLLRRALPPRRRRAGDEGPTTTRSSARSSGWRASRRTPTPSRW